MGTKIVVKLVVQIFYMRNGYGLFACTGKRVTEIPVKPGLNGLKASYAAGRYFCMVLFKKYIKFSRWRLQKAFYHPRGLGKDGCSGIGWNDICPLWTCLSRSTPEQQTRSRDRLLEEDKRSLSLNDLKEENFKPEYVSNIVVNRW